jgi:hypothetical protein
MVDTVVLGQAFQHFKIASALYVSVDVIENVIAVKLLSYWGMRQCKWSRHYATSRKVEGLRPDEVNSW